ncbi:hypothetical protein DSM110093_00330 [Sulfitobacter sp. DSM 110093]|nr:hypothetical protein DSM110093_00330 [Sulfitobacter sp. DSM 110093]
MMLIENKASRIRRSSHEGRLRAVSNIGEFPLCPLRLSSYSHIHD